VHPHPVQREPLSTVRAWSYSLNSEHDPLNLIDDGPGESPDLTFYNPSPQDNVWEFSTEQAIQIFVPSLIWNAPQLFDPTSEAVVFRQTGAFLRKHLAEMSLRVRGRTTKPGDKYLNYLETVRPNPEGQRQEIDMERLGRRSPASEKTFHIYLGVDPEFTGEIQRFWPDF